MAVVAGGLPTYSRSALALQPRGQPPPPARENRRSFTGPLAWRLEARRSRHRNRRPPADWKKTPSTKPHSNTRVAALCIGPTPGRDRAHWRTGAVSQLAVNSHYSPCRPLSSPVDRRCPQVGQRRSWTAVLLGNRSGRNGWRHANAESNVNVESNVRLPISPSRSSARERTSCRCVSLYPAWAGCVCFRRRRSRTGFSSAIV